MNVLLWISVVLVHCVFAKIEDNQNNEELAKNNLLELGTNEEIQAEVASNTIQPSFPDSNNFDLNNFQDLSTTDEPSTTEVSSPLSISTSDATSTSVTTVNPCPIPEIQILNVTAHSFDATLEWTIPEIFTCEYLFTIYLDHKKINITQELIFEILDLNACTKYEVDIQASLDDQIGTLKTFNFTTLPPEDLTDFGVENVVYNRTESTLNINWDIAEEIKQCIIEYNFTWSDQDDNYPTINILTTHYELTPIVPCGEYNITITPKINNTFGKTSDLYYEANGSPTRAPQFENLQSGQTTVNVTWIFDDRTINKCPLNDIIVTCIAPDDMNTNSSWIIKYPESQQVDISDIKVFNFTTTIMNLSPFTNYTCSGLVVNSEGNSSSNMFNINTQKDVPSEPQELTVLDLASNSFVIHWLEPEIIPGPITGYAVIIENQGSQQPPLLINCFDPNSNFTKITDPSSTSLSYTEAKPYHNYQIWVYGINDAGNGSVATSSTITTTTKPESVTHAEISNPIYSQNETYQATVTIIFEPPCHTNGPFKHYSLQYTGNRLGFEVDHNIIDTSNTTIDLELKPERNYSFEIVVVTDLTSDPSLLGLETRAGVPKVNQAKLKPPVILDSTQAHFELSSDVFDNENGEIVAIALFLVTKISNQPDYGFWNDSWPQNIENACQLTPNFWNPFTNGINRTVYILGTGSNPCNKPLNEDTTYWVLVRALTRAAFKDSLLQFKTEMYPADTSLILGLVFGILAALTISGILFYLWWRKRKSHFSEEVKKISTSSPLTVPCQKFTTYYLGIKEDFSSVKEQYDELCARSKELDVTFSYANLPENRRKNRYTNILPYDQTRVTLKIDEDDEISSDYINASYIKGYSGRVEYIASQGPLESTARDFWKMIAQENVSIIVMVSQFVEQSKEKCSQYFPNNHESLTFGESLEVKCLTELHFGTYCIRTLQIRKGNEQRHVTHMQFLEWPDFGVPQGTDNMLQFIGQIREKVNAEGGLIVVHCSAGVGRTGTLIALDILLQTIDRNEDINIYNTVFDLRKQRTNMVQTDKQYMFIHTCVKEYIETPTIQTKDSTEDHIYENMNVIRSSMKKNLIEDQVESAL